MTDEEKKPKLGSLQNQRYATIGGPRTQEPERPGTEAPRSRSAQTPERPDAETPRSRSAQTPERPGTEAPRSQTAQTPERPDARTPKRPDAQEPERPGTETPRSQSAQPPERPSTEAPKRERHTIYLPPGLSQWLKIQAIKSRSEISEVAEEAIQRYREEIER
jgi:hypothetical protein